jgi:chromosome segregation ATPase
MNKKKQIAALKAELRVANEHGQRQQDTLEKRQRELDNLHTMLQAAREGRDDAKAAHAGLKEIVVGIQQANEQLARDLFMAREDLECLAVDVRKIIAAGTRLAANDRRHTRAHRDYWKAAVAPVVADPLIYPGAPDQ